MRQAGLRVAAGAAAVLSIFGGGVAWAQLGGVPLYEGGATAGTAGQYRSPQSWAFQVSAGPYRPHVDDEFGGSKTPYRDLYGTGNHLFFAAELDWQLWHGFGSLAVGGQLGYEWQTAQDFVIDKSGNVTTTRSTVDSTTFGILPGALLGVYRLDALWPRWRVPFEPYAKLGLAYDLWWVTAGDGSISTSHGGRALGGTIGWQAAVGVGFLLDWLDPTSAQDLDTDLGINHTYIDVELDHMSVNDFGGSHGLNVGDDTWLAGLSFEF